MNKHPMKWRVDYTCCGKDAGFKEFETWARADLERRAWAESNADHDRVGTIVDLGKPLPLRKRLLSPHDFDITGEVPEELDLAIRDSVNARVLFLTDPIGLEPQDIERVFETLALYAEWSRELYDAVDRLKAQPELNAAFVLCEFDEEGMANACEGYDGRHRKSPVYHLKTSGAQ